MSVQVGIGLLERTEKRDLVVLVLCNQETPLPAKLVTGGYCSS